MIDFREAVRLWEQDRGAGWLALQQSDNEQGPLPWNCAAFMYADGVGEMGKGTLLCRLKGQKRAQKMNGVYFSGQQTEILEQALAEGRKDYDAIALLVRNAGGRHCNGRVVMRWMGLYGFAVFDYCIVQQVDAMARTSVPAAPQVSLSLSNFKWLGAERTHKSAKSSRAGRASWAEGSANQKGEGGGFGGANGPSASAAGELGSTTGTGNGTSTADKPYIIARHILAIRCMRSHCPSFHPSTIPPIFFPSVSAT